ncbi:DUF6087 family protein [Streptomyces diastatochromogenes]|uniref:DUF6087 family protein n=1 Tax=Streptomyces diastatochromogenes TaxID=42236 RepID=UPI00366812E8
MDDDEPLEQWAARREKRLRPVGELKTVIVGHETAAAHLHPHLPRVILQWDGYQWTPYRMADDYAAAQRALRGIDGDGRMPLPPAEPNPMIGRGRHRKP